MQFTAFTAALMMLVTPVAANTSVTNPINLTANSATSQDVVLAVAPTTGQSGTYTLATDAQNAIGQGVLSAPDTSANTADQAQVKAEVRAYFKDTPILATIAFCESTYRQFDGNGNVMRGKIDSDDVGVMQINEKYHKDEAEKLGYDIYTLDGNMAFAKVLYEKEGTAPWASSERCWEN